MKKVLCVFATLLILALAIPAHAVVIGDPNATITNGSLTINTAATSGFNSTIYVANSTDVGTGAVRLLITSAGPKATGFNMSAYGSGGAGLLNRSAGLFGQGDRMLIGGANGTKIFFFSNNQYGNPAGHLMIDTTGYVGIGTATPTTRLHVAGDLKTTGTLTGVDGTFTGTLSGVNGRFSGNVGIGTTSPASLLDVAGEASVNVINIRGGSDVAERFDIAGQNVVPGTVVCIDPANPGKLVVSSRAYDHTIAGIVSGANGLSTGLTLSEKGTLAHGQFPVALTGRVYCKADTSNGAIMPGDLLTTSAIPGHAMKVSDHSKSQGAILGKAMTPLASGEGMVLVLVSLQ